ncbi:MAG: hypothetical protein ACR2GY_01745 [Phycisphaerales bacterium]
MQDHHDDEQHLSIDTSSVIGFHSVPPVRYPDQYIWMIFFSAMDVMLTGLILRYGGESGVSGGAAINHELEINPVARLVIAHWGMLGASFFKFAIVSVVIVICETVGRQRDSTGLQLAWVAVLLNAFPVAWSLSLLFVNRATFFNVT